MVACVVHVYTYTYNLKAYRKSWNLVAFCGQNFWQVRWFDRCVYSAQCTYNIHRYYIYVYTRKKFYIYFSSCHSPHYHCIQNFYRAYKSQRLFKIKKNLSTLYILAGSELYDWSLRLFTLLCRVSWIYIYIVAYLHTPTHTHKYFFFVRTQRC